MRFGKGIIQVMEWALPIGIAVSGSAANAGFIEDGKASLTLKNLYFDQDFHSGDAGPSRQTDWGQGFLLDYSSGLTDGVVGVGVDVKGTAVFKLDSGGRTDKPGRTRQPGASFPLKHDNSSVDEFSSLGVAVKLALGKSVIKAGEITPNNPVITSNIGRIAPQTYTGTEATSSDLDGLKLTVGRVNAAKSRINSGHSGLSINGANTQRPSSASQDGAPARFVNEFIYAGVEYQASENLSLQYYHAQLTDFYKQDFLGLKYLLNLGPGRVNFDARQYFSTPDGKNGKASGLADGYTISGFYGEDSPYITKGKVDNRMTTLRLTYSFGTHTVGLGYQKLNGRSDLPWLNQGNGTNQYTFTSTLAAAYTRAGERTRAIDYTYDFSGLGIPGLRASAMYFYGDQIATKLGSRKEFETDYTLSYVIQDGPLKDLSFVWLNAPYRTNLETARDSDQNRFIISYTIPLK
ncbi:OprD family porin [Pantoea sp. Ap-967]|uniref:OprD family outer membrane porin n=1 Tax=Pantoea sp. Ap-967 TaxID=2608362 RepID=UPI0014237983|nr:OprD family outer membrane porin [Pantoea sp. Ap-967]NIE78034.1 OprD family porin [Pantoea sp. Ap-967]